MNPEAFIGGFPATAKIIDGGISVDVSPAPMSPDAAIRFSDMIRAASMKAKDEQNDRQ